MNFAKHGLSVLAAVLGVSLFWTQPSYSAESGAPSRIVIIAGKILAADKPGHHDYIGGCKLLKDLVARTKGTQPVLVIGGWPKDESIFDNAKAVVFYTDGGGKQAYLKSPQRIALIQEWVSKGIGIVSIHQAVDYPSKFTKQATQWIGGTYVTGKSGRGHWPSVHEEFPTHPITRGVSQWKVKDGWLNKIQFVEDMKGITPLLWSGKQHKGSPKGGAADVVSWAYDRPGGGRSFSFTGLDMHQFFKEVGVRKLLVNGILWSAGLAIPESGAACEMTDAEVDAYMTPRKSKKKPGTAQKTQSSK